LAVARRLRRVSEKGINERARIVQREDGFYWVADDGTREAGPFQTIEQASRARDEALLGPEANVLDQESDQDDAAQADDWLQAERDLGIGTWIDPDTGEPDEGRGAPHLNGDM
jgi:hypothetical protein